VTSVIESSTVETGTYRTRISGHAPDAQRLTRRIDWRFLLPEPRLRHVRFVGPRSGTLCRALSIFSESFSALEGMPSGACADLLVADSVGRRSVEAALPGLGPDGVLYWELPRWRNPLRSEAAWLANRGFDIRAHWHVPNFEECRQILPLAGPAAFASLLSEHFEWIDERVLLMLCKSLVRSNGLERVLPGISLIAARRASGMPA